METAGADEMPDEVERKGLGTPATRAGIIEKLVRIGFLERKGDKKTKHLIPTHKGTALVTVMPEQIQSPSMTADWEEKLLLIEKGEYASEDFMDEIKDVIAGLIQNYEVTRDSEVLMSKEANPRYVPMRSMPLTGESTTQHWRYGKRDFQNIITSIRYHWKSFVISHTGMRDIKVRHLLSR